MLNSKQGTICSQIHQYVRAQLPCGTLLLMSRGQTPQHYCPHWWFFFTKSLTHNGVVVCYPAVQTINPCCHSPLLPLHRTSPSVQKAEFGWRERPPWRHATICRCTLQICFNVIDKVDGRAGFCHLFCLSDVQASSSITPGNEALWRMKTSCLRKTCWLSHEHVNVTSCQSKALQLFLMVEPQKMFLHLEE